MRPYLNKQNIVEEPLSHLQICSCDYRKGNLSPLTWFLLTYPLLTAGMVKPSLGNNLVSSLFDAQTLSGDNGDL